MRAIRLDRALLRAVLILKRGAGNASAPCSFLWDYSFTVPSALNSGSFSR